GDTKYLGKGVHKEIISDDLREVSVRDIKDSNDLMMSTAIILMLLSALIISTIGMVKIWL
ncbi:MAG: hypothetical protein K6F99_10235, partial [Lachnospiraceae bacterium]|nr:hypothetical protein [Lachnospiraceae bacterium]